MYNNQCLESMFLLISILSLTSLIISTGIIASRKGILGPRKLIMSLKIIVSRSSFTFGVKRGSSLRPLSPVLSYIVVNFGVAVHPESHRGRLR